MTRDGCFKPALLQTVGIGRFLLSLCSTCKAEVTADPKTAMLGLEYGAALERGDAEAARNLERLMVS